MRQPPVLHAREILSKQLCNVGLCRHLPLRFPEVATDTTANTYYRVDLHAAPPKFRRSRSGGLVVPLFADLKRHDMGEALAEWRRSFRKCLKFHAGKLA